MLREKASQSDGKETTTENESSKIKYIDEIKAEAIDSNIEREQKDRGEDHHVEQIRKCMEPLP
jgi:hypothetical protein